MKNDFNCRRVNDQAEKFLLAALQPVILNVFFEQLSVLADLRFDR